MALCNAVCAVPVEALGGVRNLQVLNPTMTTLNVRWEPAEGKVKEYKVVYAPAAGGAESMVGLVGLLESTKEQNYNSIFRLSINIDLHFSNGSDL